MKCIICALDIEYVSIKKYFNVKYEYMIDHCQIAMCTNDVILVKTGVGKLFAEKYAEIVLSKYEITHIFSTGIAGALSPVIQIGDMVVSTSILDYKNNVDINIYQTEMDDLFCTRIDQIYTDGSVFKGTILCSDDLINDISIKENLYNSNNALCVEMESAGVIKACIKANVLFTAIKIISDLADGRAVLSMIRQQNTVTNYLGQMLSGIFNTVVT